MTDDTFNEDQMDGFRNEQLDFKQVLMNHVNRIGFLMTNIKKPDADHTMYFAVIGLESMLYPYLDEDYKKKRETLTECLMKNNWNLLTEDMEHLLKTVPRWIGPSQTITDTISRLNFTMIMFALLQELMARNGLLLEVSTDTKT